MEHIINFLVNGVCTCTVVIAGVILNCIAINIVWKNYERTNIFYQMLMYLLFLDICVLVTWMNLSLFVAYGINNTIVIHMVPYFSYPSTHIAITASTFMTVAIAHERYLAVKYPLKYSEGMKSPKATTHRLRLYLVFVSLIAIGINIPHFMDLEVIYVTNKTSPSTQDVNTSDVTTNTSYPIISDVPYVDNEEFLIISNLSTNGSTIPMKGSIANASDKNRILTMQYTSLGKHPYYLKWYRNFARLIISGIVPFTLLIYFNTVIYMAVKKSTSRRRRLSSVAHLDSLKQTSFNKLQAVPETVNGMQNPPLSGGRKCRRKSIFNKRKDEENLSMVFVVIVTAFLLCHILKFILNFYEGFFGKVGATSASRIAGCFSNFLVVLNSSINTIIYCIMNDKFRNYFFDVMKNMIPSVTSHNKSESQPEPGVAADQKNIENNGHLKRNSFPTTYCDTPV